jgi:16S rRNA (uracil1498-N3)-methyltransferase
VQQPPRSLVDDLASDDVALPTGERHHVERVLRVRDGDVLELVDGRGGRALARWTADGRARIEQRFPTEPPTAQPLRLAVAPPRLPRLEWLVEKACELDVTELLLLDTRRAERLPGEGKLDRLQRIADQALLQCRRLHRMPVRAPLALEALLARPRNGALWLARPPTTGAAPKPVPGSAGGLLVLVGPEGGFDPDEERAALAAGAQTVALGATTLRVETAALAMAVLAVLARADADPV